MADIIEVSEAVIARLEPVLPHWNTAWYEPQPIPNPLLCVLPDPARFADYQQTTGSSYTRWYLRLGFYVAANDEQGARRTMAELTDPDGPVHTALLDPDVEDALFELAPMRVAVTTGKGWSTIRRNKNRYLYAEVGITVDAN